MNFILGAKVVFCGNWQNIFCLFLRKVLKKVKAFWKLVLFMVS